MWSKLGILLVTQSAQISKFIGVKQFQEVPSQPRGISVCQTFLGKMNVSSCTTYFIARIDEYKLLQQSKLNYIK